MVCLLDLPVIRFFQLSWETKVIGATWKLEGVLSHALFLYMKPCMLYIYRGFFCVCVCFGPSAVSNLLVHFLENLLLLRICMHDAQQR